MKKILSFLFFLIMTSIASADLFFGMPIPVNGDSLGGVQVQRGDTPFPDGAIFPVPYELRGVQASYLKIVDGIIVVKSDVEKAFVDLPIQYKKLVDGQWIEMTDDEKRIVDLPAKYKHADGTEMTDDEKAAVDDAEAAAQVQTELDRQAAKPDMQKAFENSYITFLTNEWTTLLINKGLIGADEVINVDSTDFSGNMLYIVALCTSGDGTNYDYYANAFVRFKNTLRDVFNSDIKDCQWHPEMVGVLTSDLFQTAAQSKRTDFKKPLPPKPGPIILKTKSNTKIKTSLPVPNTKEKSDDSIWSKIGSWFRK
jgi:hypothetical protein